MGQCSPDYFELRGLHGLEPDTPFYVYDLGVVAEKVRALRGVLGHVDLLYSIKCNPNPALVRFLAGLGLGMDAASRAEVLAARASGVEPDRVLYSAPGKSDEDLRICLGAGTLVADSYGELARLDALCRTLGTRAGVGLRVSPNLSFGQGDFPELLPAVPDKFGVEEEGLADHADFLRSLERVRVVGLHAHVRSQVLSADALSRAFVHVAGIARRLRGLGFELQFVNLGGGLGLPRGASGALSLTALGEGLARAAREVPGTRLFLESGRFLAGEAGVFVTPILDIKESRGKTFVYAPGLLNHFFRASFAALMEGLPLREGFPGPLEPLWSGPGIDVPRVVGKKAPGRVVTVCGTLCTANDVVARDVYLDNVAVGNLLVFPRAGAYANALSPHGFAGHPPCAEIVLPATG